MKQFSCRIIIDISGNHESAKDEDEYVELIIDRFLRDHNMHLDASEITEVQEFVQ